MADPGPLRDRRPRCDADAQPARRLNTIVPDMMEEFDAAMQRAIDDGNVRVVRLRGAGRAFCAGYDIDWGAEMMEKVPSPWDPILDYQVMSSYVTSYMSLWRSPKPVIAQVHGFCVGGGTDFALCSDLIVCAEDCRIGYPPARVWGSPTTAMWMYRIGLERTKRLLLTGDPVDGRTAVAWGLASESAPKRIWTRRLSRSRSGSPRFPPTSST